MAKRARVDKKIVKEVVLQHQVFGHIKTFSYQNLYSQTEIEELHKTIEDPEEKYFSIRTLKQQHRQLSRHKIRKELKTMKYRFKKLKKRGMRQAGRYVPDYSRVNQIISHILTGLSMEGHQILYLDEMKFPLN